ncbi:MAG: hypothetical protein AB201_00255 [Parcubacteria bacterium C7867-006]|nr:MAG: hypothetical protein AB201_00255 [Parcubacteria bacterium C7867-006]
MMKKIILNSLITALALGGAVVANAETNSSSTIRNQMKTVRQDTRAEIKNIASSTQAQINALKDLIKNKVEKRYGKMFDRFQATIDREKIIMAKINSRIDKIKANGGSTTEAEKLVASAKTHIDEAQKNLDALEVIANEDKEIASSTTDRLSTTTIKSMRNSAQEIEKHLREAHKDLLKSVGVLRGVSQLKNASSTKETN